MTVTLDIPPELEGGCLRAIRWPLRGHLGLCYQHDHIGVYYMRPAILGLYDIGENFELLGPFPALGVGCRNCHCGWQERADSCVHWWDDSYERDD